jgi:hypothetical protein
MSCSGRDASGFGNSVGYSKGRFLIGSGLLPGALGGTRTPSLLIRSKIRAIQSGLWLSDRPARGGHGRALGPAASKVIQIWC